jgi:C-terminal processing protease CtpA/Prc
VRAAILALALVSPLVSPALAQEPIPKPELQLLSDVVRYIKRDFAGGVDDTVIASGCADAVAAQAGTAERAARLLEDVPPLLMRAKAARAETDYRKLVHACIEGMVSMLDLHSKFMSEAEFRALYRSSPKPAATPTARASWGEGDILQLRIARFSEGTRNEVLRELAALPGAATREPRGIVLDLRDNSGGTLLAAVDVSGLFLNEGVEVGTTRGRNMRLMQSFRVSERSRGAYAMVLPARLSEALRRVPIAVLVNQNTAAGAEILAAALQGNQRAQLVGARTLGMGSVQTLFPLAGGAALKVTTAYWHAPKDVQLEGRPLQPDVSADGEGAMREALRWLAEARK